jgi:hypothetical protein
MWIGEGWIVVFISYKNGVNLYNFVFFCKESTRKSKKHHWNVKIMKLKINPSPFTCSHFCYTPSVISVSIILFLYCFYFSYYICSQMRSVFCHHNVSNSVTIFAFVLRYSICIMFALNIGVYYFFSRVVKSAVVKSFSRFEKELLWWWW